MAVCVFLVLLLQVMVVRGWQANNEPITNRMFGSHDASNGQFPYVTFHLMEAGRNYDTCTGSIIGKWWVLFAAHCIRPGHHPKSHVVVAGNADLANYVNARQRYIHISQDIDEKRYDVQERRAAALFQHPNYRPPGQHDVALVKLAKPFRFNERVQPIPISKVPFAPQTNCTIAGFGRVEGNKQRYVLQYITNMSAKPSTLCRFKTVHKDAICLGETFRGICSGDSGGALACEGKLTGIASYTASTLPICGLGVHEQYYTDIEESRRWIISVKNANRPLK